MKKLSVFIERRRLYATEGTLDQLEAHSTEDYAYPREDTADHLFHEPMLVTFLK